MTRSACRVLLIHPRFHGGSFWNYTPVCALVGAKYPAPPLGLITVAAMLPESWEVRLCDRNVAELTPEALDWAELVLIGGMLPQQPDILHLIGACRRRGVPVAIGGPDVSSHPDIYEDADFRIIGEAEGAIDAFVAAWERGERRGTFTAPLHTVDITQSPTPRFDLLDFGAYLQVNVQYSRGCPFLCEFCDIIELYGRKPRTKTTPQILAELERLHELGYRGHVDFVDDNLIGNKKAVKALLPDLVAWQKARGYPFEFSTEASLNLADDPEMLAMMRDAGFFACFVGIESPDPDVLVMAQKKQNTRRDIARSIHAINEAGIFVVGGFIVGFDNEKPGVDAALIALIEDASIPISMAGLLFALPNTQLSRRLAKEGRLHDKFATFEHETDGGDQCTAGLNFETVRPRGEVMRDYLRLVSHIYDSENYFARIRRTVDLLGVDGPNCDLRASTIRHDIRMITRFLWTIAWRRKALRGPVFRLLAHVLRTKPRALKHALLMAGMYAHLGPFARYVVAEIEARIAREAAAPPPALMTAAE